jgi:hypothetical protein
MPIPPPSSSVPYALPSHSLRDLFIWTPFYLQ